MRAMILLAVTGLAAFTGLFWPQWTLYTYIWFALMRPDYMAFAAGRYQFSEYMAIGLIIGSARYLINGPRAWLTNPLSLLLVLLQFPLLISTRYALHYELAYSQYIQFLRMSAVALLVPLLITEVETLKKVFLVTAFSLGYWGLRDGVTGMLHGGLRISAGPGGFMTENNTYACGLVMVIPFCWYGQYMVKNRWLRLVLVGMTLSSMATVVLTFSRGAALALGVIILIVVMRSKHKILTLIGAVVIGIIPVTYLVHDAYIARMSTIAKYETDSSAMSRIRVARFAYLVWRDHPLIGVGLGDENLIDAYSGYADPTDRFEVHNSFLQILSHCGIFAFFIYIALLGYGLWMTWRSGSKMRKTHPGLEHYPRALNLSLVGFVICSVTQPRATFDFTYLVLMYAAAWYAIWKRLPSAAAGESPAPAAAWSRPVSLPAPARYSAGPTGVSG